MCQVHFVSLECQRKVQSICLDWPSVAQGTVMSVTMFYCQNRMDSLMLGIFLFRLKMNLSIFDVVQKTLYAQA